VRRIRSTGPTSPAVVPALLAVVGLALAPAGLRAAGASDPLPPAGAAQEEDGARSLTLEEAIAGALAKNDAVRIQRVALDSARAAVTGARGAYDPLLTVDAAWESVTAPVNSAFSGAPPGEAAPTDRTLDASANLQQLLPTGALLTLSTGSSRDTTNGSFALLSPAYQSQLGVDLRQPLLRDRAIDPARLGLRVTAADRRSAAESLREQVADTVAAVENAYWSLVAARRAVRVQEEAVSLAAHQLDETKARIESGASPETEIAQPRAELERRRGDLLAAREAASRAETALKTLILGDEAAAWAERLDPVDEIAVRVEPVDVAAATQQALASRPELAVAEATVARRRAEAEFAHNQTHPALDLVVSYNRYGLAGLHNPAASEIPGLPTGVPPGLQGDLGDALGQLRSPRFDDTRAALELQVPIGNRAARAGAVMAKDALVQAEAGVTSVRKEIRAEVLDAAAATDTAGGRIEAARAGLKAAEVQLSAEEDRFRVGLSTNFLVLTRQNDLSAAKLAEINALADYRKARTELARASGSLLQERGIDLERPRSSER
jgi:outer membrane protein